MIPFFIFIFGTIFGSFLNAVVYRLHQEESFVRGRSKCPKCQHELTVIDLVPLVSWLSLGGRCRYCRQAISWQYPLAELATGLSFVVIYLAAVAAFGNLWTESLQVAFWFMAVLFLIVIFIYDLNYYLILDAVVLPAAALFFILNIFLGFIWWQMLLAAAVAGGFFFLQFAVSRGRWIGGGDIKLGVLMGLMLSWPYVLAALFLAYMLGSVVGLVLILQRKKEWGGQLPFGTFLSLATFIVMIYGHQMVNWYLRLLQIG